ncbi:EAL domain-containing protein [Shewanella marisflavi]|nr:EAL domain-containing protein [Shewanella marisflavi]
MALTVSGYVFAGSENPSIKLNGHIYSVPEGLSQSTVTSIVEDDNGYVWVGTLNGLNRFDGHEFKHYLADNKSGLPSSFIRSLSFTKNSELLVGTDSGIVYFEPELDKFIEKKISLDNNNIAIWSIYSDKNILILGTDNELIIFNEGIVVKKYPEIKEAKKIVSTNDEYIIKTYNGELYRINKSLDLPELIGSNILDVTSTENEFIYIDNSSINFNKIDFKISNSNKLTNIHASKNIIFATNENSIFEIKEKSIIKIGTIDKKAEFGSVSYFYTTENSKYIGLINEGLLEVKDSKNLISNLSNFDKNIWHFSTDKFKNILVSSDDEYVKLYDKKLNLIKKINTGIQGYKNTISIGDDIYIGSHKGLFSLRNDKIIQILNDTITVLTSNEKILYAGTSNGKLHIFDNNNELLTIETQDNAPILGVLNFKDNELYIASQSGFYQYKNKSLVKIDDQITFSLEISNDNVILGTSTSIKSYSPNDSTLKTLFSNNKDIYSIKFINDYIVAASIGEIILLSENSHWSFPTNYGSQHEYNTPSSIKYGNEHVLFGGIDGASLVDLNKINNYIRKDIKPSTIVKDLLIFNTPIEIGSSYLSKSISHTKKITLKYSDYPFTFKFITPNAPIDNLEYFYQMEGLSEDWIESKGNNSSTYTNLSPGNYNFNVYAVNPITKSKGETTSINIDITPPWWLSIQAKLVYLMITLLITGAIVKAALRRREVQRQIAKSEERLKLSLWGSGDEMWDWDIETGQIYRSNIWGSLEFPRDGQRSGEAGEESNIHPMDQERVNTALNKHFYGETDHFEAAYRVKGKDDQWIWILDRAKIVERDENDKALRMTGTIKNISNFKQAEEQLRLFERAIENISEGMFILDNKFKFVEVNEACCDLCEKSRNDFIGELFQFDLYPESYSEQIRHILQQQGSWSNEVESSRGDGSSFLMELTVDAIYDEQGVLSHYVGVFSDISRRKQQEEELRKLTNNDLLTSLPNRSSLMVTLGNLVKKDTHHTLMVLDLDNFKKINDSLGHQVGDELLIKVARRIESTVPYHTSIYRLGGDEFAILVDNNPDIGSSAVIANHVVDAFSSPFELTKDRVVVGVSIGIVLYPEDDQNEQALLRKADIAMYHAKSAGGNRYQFYSESLNRNAIRQLEVENLIREGLRDDLFEVYYQPKIDLKSSKMAGMEALVRLNHPKHGLISPGEFIPLAEENGLIVEIGEVVLRKACFAAQNWRRQKLFNGRVAVNLSSQQFALPDLQQRIESILRLTQLPAANLELEITEGTVIKQPEKAIKVMMQLSKMGVSLALDDFGTGYSSLSYLKRFPIDTLKIDKAFVDDIDKSDRDLKMVDSIITIAHNMGLSVVGEGVEEASQLNILKALKCEEIQGFIYSKAVDETCFTELLKQEIFSYKPVSSHKKA